MPIRFGFFLVHFFPMYVVMLAAEALRLANKHSGRRAFDWVLVSESGSPVRASNGIQMDCDSTINESLDLSYVFVVAGDDQSRTLTRPLKNWLVRMEGVASTKLGAIDSGGFLLAACRLIRGRTVTVHPDSLAAFCEQFPSVRTEMSPFVEDGSLITCAGGLAIISLMLTLIERHCGVAVKTSVARDLVACELRPTSASEVNRSSSMDGGIEVVIETMQAALEEPMTLAELAHKTRVSTRQLSRLFQDRLGCGPMTHYRRLRRDSARQLILQSDLAISSIAVATGFQSVSAFSRAFSTQFGQSPRSMLSRFRRVGNASTVPSGNYRKRVMSA